MFDCLVLSWWNYLVRVRKCGLIGEGSGPDVSSKLLLQHLVCLLAPTMTVRAPPSKKNEGKLAIKCFFYKLPCSLSFVMTIEN